MNENNLRELLLSADPVAILRRKDEDGSLGDLDESISGLRMPPLPGVHHKDNLDHSIKVVENAISFENGTADLVLRAAALLHDVGKPATRRPAAHKTVTFDGHETVGARMVPAILKRHGFSKSESKLVAELVALHMRSHGSELWSDSAIRRLMADVSSEEQMNRLVIIFRSDVTTRHNSRKRRIHSSIDQIEAGMARVRAADARAALRPAMNGHEVMAHLGITAGRKLGEVMRLLNTDEHIGKTKEEVKALLEQFR